MSASEFYCDQCHVTFFASASPENATIICPECGHSHLLESALQARSTDGVDKALPHKLSTDWVGIIGLLTFGLAMILMCSFGIYLFLKNSDEFVAEFDTAIKPKAKPKRMAFAVGVPQLSQQLKHRAFVPNDAVPMETTWAPGQVRFYKASITTEDPSIRKPYEMICRLECEAATASFDVEKGTCYGTAIVLSSEGHLLVRAATAISARDIIVRINGDRHRAELLTYDRAHDLAIIKIDVSGLTACRQGDFSDISGDQSISLVGYAKEQFFIQSKQVRVTVENIDSTKQDLLHRTMLDVSVDESFENAPVLNANHQICGITAFPPGIPGTTQPPRLQSLAGLDDLLKHVTVKLPEGKTESLKSGDNVPFLVPYLITDRFQGPYEKIKFQTAMEATPDGTNFNTSPGKAETSSGTVQVDPTGRFLDNHFGHKVFEMPSPIHSTVFAILDKTGSSTWTTEELIRESPPGSGLFSPVPRPNFRNETLQKYYNRGRPAPTKRPDRFFREQTVCRRKN